MMSIEDAHEWAKGVRAEWDERVKNGDSVAEHFNKEVETVGKSEVAPVAFARTERPSFTGEVGTVDSDLFFHFWPSNDDRYSSVMQIADESVRVFCDVFADALATSFIEVFKFEDKMCWDFVPEMNSWVVRVSGFADNPHSDELAARLFDVLQNRLEK
jgi:hypothetical protein